MVLLVFHFPKTYTWWSCKSSYFLISWNLADFTVKSSRFQWITVDFSGFYEILLQILWNPAADFNWFHEILLQISWNPADFSRFHEILLRILWNPPENLINQIIQQKLFTFMKCSGKVMSQDFMKSARFHETKDQLPGMVRPMFSIITLLFISDGLALVVTLNHLLIHYSWHIPLYHYIYHHNIHFLIVLLLCFSVLLFLFYLDYLFMYESDLSVQTIPM